MDHAPDMELMDIGNEPEEIAQHLRQKNIPDVMIAIGSSGVYPQTIPLLSQTKVFLFWDDIHWYGNSSLVSRHRIFRAADVLLLPYYEMFLKIEAYKEYYDRALEFPWFAPMECFESQQPWESRENKIVISGASRRDVYPLRYAVRKHAIQYPKGFDLLSHPGYTNKNQTPHHNIMGPEYYSYLRRFQGAIGTSGIPPVKEVVDPYPLCKFFEIPGCGCTPFFEQIPSLDALGFIPGEHYIPIDLRHFPKQLVLNDSCETIAQKAQAFVRSYHSADIRSIQLLNIIREKV